MVQWLRCSTSNAGGLGSIPGLGTRTNMPQLSVPKLQLKVLHAATKTQHSQINILKNTMGQKNTIYTSVQCIFHGGALP